LECGSVILTEILYKETFLFTKEMLVINMDTNQQSISDEFKQK